MRKTTQAERRELSESWPIALAAFLGVAGGVSSLPYSTQGLFVGPLTGEFGWSREQMSLVTLVGGMLLAALSPLVGSIVDKIGVLYPLAISFCAMIIGYLALSMTGGSFALFFQLQLFLIAMGSATGPVSFTRIINEHFVAARGLALGATLAGAGVMGVIAPPIIASLIAGYSWRAGYLVMALLIFLLAFCSVSLLIRRGAAKAQAKGVTAIEDVTHAPANLSSPFLWRLAITFLLMAFGVGGFTFHLVPMLVDGGVDLPAAARIQSLIGVAMLIGRLSAGALMDRVFAPYVTASVVILAALGIMGIALFGVAAAAPCALLIGLALGAEGDAIGYLTARYFGMAAYGRTYGVLYGVYAFGLGLSPVLISRLQSLSHSYESSLWLSSVILSIAALLLVSLPSFSKRA